MNLGAPSTQTQFGDLVGISQPAVSDLLARRVLSSGQTAGEWLHLYCAHLRETAAGRASSGDLDLVQERARLAKEQADRVAMANATTRRELAPAYVLEMVLANVGRQIAGILESVPVHLKRRQGLPSDAVDYVEKELIRARNLAAEIQINWDELPNGQSGDPGGGAEGAGAADDA